jgi:hypothetical protein
VLKSPGEVGRLITEAIAEAAAPSASGQVDAKPAAPPLKP